MKFLFLTSQVIDERNYQRFGLNILQKIGSLTIADLTNLVNPSIYQNQIKKQKKNINIFTINSKSELKKFFLRLDSYNYVVSILGNLNRENYFIYSMLKFHQKKLTILTISSIPTKLSKKKIINYHNLSVKFSREISLKGLIRKIYFNLLFKLSFSSFPKAKYIIACSTATIERYQSFIDKNTKVISSCSYDFIIAKNTGKNLIQFKYILFLDEDLISHQDFVAYDIKIEDEKLYYSELINFFKFLEKTFNFKIVIAAHPRSKINFTKNRFKDFTVIQGKTETLVKYSELCITSASTSINFAVIFKKPILFITTERMKRTRDDNEILASHFFQIPTNISNKSSFHKVNQSIFSFKPEIYESYFFKHISFSREPLFSFEALKKELNI